MTTRSGAKRAPEGGSTPARRQAEEREGETPRPYIELRAIRPSEIPRSASVLDTKNIACYPPKTTLGSTPREVSFGVI